MGGVEWRIGRNGLVMGRSKTVQMGDQEEWALRTYPRNGGLAEGGEGAGPTGAKQEEWGLHMEAWTIAEKDHSVLGAGTKARSYARKRRGGRTRRERKELERTRTGKRRGTMSARHNEHIASSKPQSPDFATSLPRMPPPQRSVRPCKGKALSMGATMGATTARNGSNAFQQHTKNPLGRVCGLGQRTQAAERPFPVAHVPPLRPSNSLRASMPC